MKLPKWVLHYSSFRHMLLPIYSYLRASVPRIAVRSTILSNANVFPLTTLPSPDFALTSVQ